MKITMILILSSIAVKFNNMLEILDLKIKSKVF